MKIRFTGKKGYPAGSFVTVTRGELRQSDYTRGRVTEATSKSLKTFRTCVGGKLDGIDAGDRRVARTNFCVAAVKCAPKPTLTVEECQKKYGVKHSIPADRV